MEISEIFKRINQSGLNYVLFTGNTGIQNSINGTSDFDILVSKKDGHAFEKMMLDIGCKRRISTFDKFYFGVDNFIFFDEENELMHHFHLHYELIFGSKHDFKYYIKDPSFCFKNYTHDDFIDVKIVTPEVEFIIVCLKILSSKSSWIKTAKNLVRRKANNKYLIKHEKLISLVNKERLIAILKKHFKDSKEIILFLFEIKKPTLSFLKIELIRLRSKSVLQKYHRFNSKTHDQLKKVRLLSQSVSTKSISQGGKIISLIGVDGAGKTTLSREINEWLNYKLSSKNIFLGQVKNNKINWILRKISKIFNFLQLKYISNFLKDLTHIVNAEFRRKNIALANNLTQRGVFVITDRYPLKEFWNMNLIMDGPKLKKKSFLYKKERKIYSYIDDYPHLIIILKIPIEVSVARKPDEHCGIDRINNLKKKIEAINNIENLSNVVVVDATKSYENVRKEVKSIIWNNIN